MAAKSTAGFEIAYTLDGHRIRPPFQQPLVLIGRSLVCDVVIDSADLSRKHAEICEDEWGWKIHDLNSRGGTFVNAERVAARRLHDGDQIVLSPAASKPVVITFHLATAPPVSQQRVLLRDSPERSQVLASIDLKDFEQSLVSPPSEHLGPEHWPARRSGAVHQSPAAGPPPMPVPLLRIPRSRC